MHETVQVDPGILHMVKNLGSGTQTPIILALTLNGLDAVHRKEATFIAMRGDPFFFKYDP